MEETLTPAPAAPEDDLLGGQTPALYCSVVFVRL